MLNKKIGQWPSEGIKIKKFPMKNTKKIEKLKKKLLRGVKKLNHINENSNRKGLDRKE